MTTPCSECDKRFSTIFNLNKHRRTVHNLSIAFKTYSQDVWSHVCLEQDCSTSFRRNSELIQHLVEVHDMNIYTEKLEFPNMEAFQIWKRDLEWEENCSYVLARGKRANKKGEQTIHFVCNRSGKNRIRKVNNGTNRKLRGSCKLGRSCISDISVIKKPDKVLVTHVMNHYGHEVWLKLPQKLKQEEIAAAEISVIKDDTVIDRIDNESLHHIAQENVDKVKNYNLEIKESEQDKVDIYQHAGNDPPSAAPDHMLDVREEVVWTEGYKDVPTECETELVEDEIITEEEEEEEVVQDEEEEVMEESSDEHANDEEQQALKNVRKQLCRVCGKKTELLLPIYQTYGYNEGDVPMVVKIEMYLPIKVEAGDGLPEGICSFCSVMVNRWHDLNVTCLSADAALRKIFCNTEIKDEEPVDLKSVAKKYSIPKATDADFGSDICQDVGGETNRKPSHKKNVTRDLFHKDEIPTPVEPSLLPCCCYCRETFDFYDDRKNHLGICRELPAICEFCGEDIPHRKLLSKHRIKHVERKKYSRSFMCEKCARCLCSAQALEYHAAVVHGNKCVPKYYCELCCKIMYSKLHYQAHLKSHAAGRIKSKFKIDAIHRDKHSAVYACPVCDDTFSDKLKLVIHLTAKKSTYCPKCRVRLRSEKKILFHRCKKLLCEQCSKVFFRKAVLEAHQRKHNLEALEEGKE